MSFTSLNGFKQVHGFRDPLTRERQRLVSLFAVRSPASSPLTPFGGTSFTAHNIPRLCRGEARPAADSELVRLRRSPLTPAPSAHNCGDCGRRADGFGENGFLEDGFERVAGAKDLRDFGQRAHPQSRALRHKTRRLWPALRTAGGRGQRRQVCRAPRVFSGVFKSNNRNIWLERSIGGTFIARFPSRDRKDM